MVKSGSSPGMSNVTAIYTSFLMASIANGAETQKLVFVLPLAQRVYWDSQRYNSTAPTMTFCTKKVASCSSALISAALGCGGAAKGIYQPCYPPKSPQLPR